MLPSQNPFGTVVVSGFGPGMEVAQLASNSATKIALNALVTESEAAI